MTSTNIRVSKEARGWIIRQAGLQQIKTGKECTAREILDWLIADWQERSGRADLIDAQSSLSRK